MSVHSLTWSLKRRRNNVWCTWIDYGSPILDSVSIRDALLYEWQTVPLTFFFLLYMYRYIGIECTLGLFGYIWLITTKWINKGFLAIILLNLIGMCDSYCSILDFLIFFTVLLPLRGCVNSYFTPCATWCFNFKISVKILLRYNCEQSSK